MKTKKFASILLLVFALGIVSCDKTDDPAPSNTITFQVTMTGANEVPANTSAATGSATFTYNKTTYILSGTVSFSGLTPTAGHIHKGAAGTNGGVIFPLGTAPFTSPIAFAPVTLDATQQADLMANMYYVNLHSVALPGGEIRGQLIKP